MKIIISTILLLTSLQTYAQFDYDSYMSFLSKENLLQNRKLISLKVFQLEKHGGQTITSSQQFNKNGLPTKIVEFDQKGQVAGNNDFVYDASGIIKKIETYKKGKHENSTEFEINLLGQITTFTEYGYSSYDGEKLFIWKTLLEYNSNNTLKKIIKLQGDNRDTTKISFYNSLGVKTKTRMNMDGLRTKKIEYIYNKDSTEMLEKHYENDTTVYSTITHRYKNRKEIEKIDPSTSKKPFYWKYDTNGNVIETNEAFFYVLYNKYNSEGFLTNKTLEILFSDSDEKNLPKKIEFKYDYQFRQ